MSKKILVVDDDADVRIILETGLKNAGFTVFLAKDGPEGVDLAHKNEPDLILLDIMLPAMDGFGVQQMILQDPLIRKTPILFITAVNDPASKSWTKFQGAVGYIEKPFNVKSVVAQVSALLSRNP